MSTNTPVTDLDISPPLEEAAFELAGIPYHWMLARGQFDYGGTASTIFWTGSSLAEMLAAMYRFAGPRRFPLVLKAQGRKSEVEDWAFICSFPSFLEGLRGINRISVTAGWGRMFLDLYDPDNRRAVMRVENSWESIAQRALGVVWGSHYFAGKVSGWFSRHFGVNCWAEQTSFSAGGDSFDTFQIGVAPTTIEEELELIEREEAERAHGLEARTAELSAAMERLASARLEVEEKAKLIERLSIPVVRLWDGIVLLSLVGEMNQERAEHLIEKALTAVSTRAVRILLVDVSGTSTVDEATADALIRMVRAVALLGTESVLVGIRPQVAQSLVSLGVSLSGVTTYADVQEGLEAAFQKIGVVTAHANSSIAVGPAKTR